MPYRLLAAPGSQSSFAPWPTHGAFRFWKSFEVASGMRLRWQKRRGWSIRVCRSTSWSCEYIESSRSAAARECRLAGLLCNDSTPVQKEDRWEVNGDPTEVALIVAAGKAGLAEEQIQQQLPRLDSGPFESQHQYMATLHDRGDNGSRLVYVKGAV